MNIIIILHLKWQHFPKTPYCMQFWTKVGIHTLSSKDLFLNMQKVKVQFFRNKLNAIAGYINDKDTFNLLSKNVCFPKEIRFKR